MGKDEKEELAKTSDTAAESSSKTSKRAIERWSRYILGSVMECFGALRSVTFEVIELYAVQSTFSKRVCGKSRRHNCGCQQARSPLWLLFTLVGDV